MGNAASLRLDRVFLSANPRNIEVLRAIADHDNYRRGVVELVWDDARLSDKEASADWDVEEWGLTIEPGSWFERQMQKNLDILVHRRTPDDLKLPYHAARAEQVASQMRVEEAESLYRELLRQQEEVMASGADVEALSYALNRFSSLRRVVITPATHGFLFTPLYETPMIRALPRGFNYPIPRGWPTEEGVQPGPVARAWNDADEAYRARWRGFRLVVRALAQRPPPAPGDGAAVSEIVVTAAQLRTGLNCRIFDEPCPELDDFCALLRRPGFARLDLDLLVGGQDRIGWSSFRSGHLQRALAGAKSMRHVSLSTDVLSDPDTRAAEQLIPLATIFPVEKWAHLRHFGLSRFPVDQGDVVALLKVLPATLQSVELSFLLFLDECGSYRDLLRHMRRELGKWRDREVRPHTIVGVEQHIPVIGRGIWLETEVDRFLYEEGPNPFGGEDHWDPDLPLPGFGIVKDKFEPDEYTRPNEEYAKMVQLGYYEGPALVRVG